MLSRRRHAGSTARTCSCPRAARRSAADRDQFAVRFHLHPAIKASRLADGHGAMLVLPNRDVWTFNAYEDRVELEESVYLAGTDGPRRTLQIVIYGRARKVLRVQWTLRGAARARRRHRRRAARARTSRNCRCDAGGRDAREECIRYPGQRNLAEPLSRRADGDYWMPRYRA